MSTFCYFLYWLKIDGIVFCFSRHSSGFDSIPWWLRWNTPTRHYPITQCSCQRCNYYMGILQTAVIKEGLVRLVWRTFNVDICNEQFYLSNYSRNPHKRTYIFKQQPAKSSYFLPLTTLILGMGKCKFDRDMHKLYIYNSCILSYHLFCF